MIKCQFRFATIVSHAMLACCLTKLATVVYVKSDLIASSCVREIHRCRQLASPPRVGQARGYEVVNITSHK
jgi:hypothetical protein